MNHPKDELTVEAATALWVVAQKRRHRREKLQMTVVFVGSALVIVASLVVLL